MPLCGVTCHDWLDRRGRLPGPYESLSSLIKKPSAEHPAEKLRSHRVDLVQVVTLAGSRTEGLHASHSARASPWHLRQCRFRQEL